MATLDKEIKIMMLKGEKGQNGTDGQDGQDGKSSYELAVEELHYSGTLEEWLESFATPENYVTRNEFQKVTQAEYDALVQAHELIPDCYYIITDDTSYDDMIDRIEEVETGFSELEESFSDLEDSYDDFKEEVRTMIQAGLKPVLTSIDCACNFLYWQNNDTTNSYSRNSNIDYISLKDNTGGISYDQGHNKVNILPALSNTSIAVARVDYVSGDDGYIQYNLDTINANVSYITFTAKNINANAIYPPNYSTSVTMYPKSTTFRIYVRDVFNNVFTKEFTINFKTAVL